MTPLGAHVRPVDLPADLPAVRALFTAYIDSLRQDLGLDLGFQNVEAELAALPGAYAPPQGALLMAELDGSVVGLAAMRPLPCGSAEMKRMYLRPAARGRGLGRALAEAIVAAARAGGYRRIRLDTQRDFGAAVALYRSLGFAETARYNDNPLPRAMFMALDLTPDAA